MKVVAIFAAFFFFVVLSLGLGWLVEGNDFFMYKYFAPQRAAVERQVFENTPSYNQGMIHDLEGLQTQYIQATPVQQAGLASIILHRAEAYGVEKLPIDLRQFVDGLREKRNSPNK